MDTRTYRVVTSKTVPKMDSFANWAMTERWGWRRGKDVDGLERRRARLEERKKGRGRRVFDYCVFVCETVEKRKAAWWRRKRGGGDMEEKERKSKRKNERTVSAGDADADDRSLVRRSGTEGTPATAIDMGPCGLSSLFLFVFCRLRVCVCAFFFLSPCCSRGMMSWQFFCFSRFAGQQPTSHKGCWLSWSPLFLQNAGRSCSRHRWSTIIIIHILLFICSTICTCKTRIVTTTWELKSLATACPP